MPDPFFDDPFFDPFFGERGVEELQVSNIISKNTPLPCSKTDTFYTIGEGQRYVQCRVTQSADEETDPEFVQMILDNVELGPFPPGRPAQQPIEVTYSYDLDQTMHVKFTDVKSGMVFERTLELSDEVESTINVPDFRID